MMSDQELAETIQKEAAQQIPFDIADVSIDYQILSEDPTSPQMDVLLVAVKKDKILNYTNVLSMAGKAPAIVDIDAFALQNCYEYNYEPAAGSTVALLNLGASVMNINIVKGNIPLFTRDVSVGGHQYTDSLQKELDLSFEDAESLKLGNKIGTVSEDAKLPILQQVTEIIVLEIQKTFDFFRATAAGEQRADTQAALAFFYEPPSLINFRPLPDVGCNFPQNLTLRFGQHQVPPHGCGLDALGQIVESRPGLDTASLPKFGAGILFIAGVQAQFSASRLDAARTKVELRHYVLDLSVELVKFFAERILPKRFLFGRTWFVHIEANDEPAPRAQRFATAD